MKTNPETIRCHLKLKYGKWNRRTKKYEPTSPVKIAESSSFQSKAEASGIRFASRDSVKVASSWMIAHYAETFKNLAEPKEKPPTQPTS